MMNTVKKNSKAIALLLFLIIVFFSFPYLCSAHEKDELHHHDHGEHQHDHVKEPPNFKYSREANVKTASEQPKPRKQMSTSSLWLEALSSTLIISIAPFFILFFVPLNSRRDHEDVLKVLLSFASGGLLGDAFLHLIPHALEPHSHIHSDHHHHGHSHEHSHSHGNDNVGTWVLCGILAFLIVEKCVRLMKGDHSHAHLLADSTENEEKPETNEKNEEKSNENDNSDAMSESEDEIQIAGYLNLAADFTHNFTDGLAIGASYLAGETVGLVTTITILFHEIPHEIGDFAILVQSGCSKKKAMLLQLITAFGALSGTLVALISGGVDVNTTSWVLPFTAGGFIYISTVSIIPELLRDTTFVQSVKEIFALLFGVLMMVIVAQFE